jgi:hypothetical protein
MFLITATAMRNMTSSTDDFEVAWIITNPPFRRAEDLALKALERARVGVALFTRLQWLEGVGRYNRLFNEHPPTLVAIFSERVPLCMARWNPRGSTATAYCWLIWIKGRTPQPPFWIPPGQRKLCTKPDDIERFTASPVIKRIFPFARAASSPLIASH